MEDLSKQLKELGASLDEKMREQYNRSLPFQETLFDRWDRAKALNFGEGTSIYESALVFGDVKVGKDCWVGPYTILDGSGDLSIGDNCSISSGVHIYTHDSSKKRVSGGSAEIEKASVNIKSNCYIGPYSIVLKGVQIGENSIIGGNSLVNKSVPPFSVAFGSPLRIVGKVIVENGKVSIEYNQKDRITELEEKIEKLEKMIEGKNG
jgi:acetyltransferase-like isoleucine patch superfamily enzyme